MAIKQEHLSSDTRVMSNNLSITAHPTPSQSLGEEIANSVSHGIGFVAAVAATPFLIVTAINSGKPNFILGASIFSATMILLYMASMLYHAFPPGRAKRIFKTIDHAAIFLMIAGTYTPFTLGVLRGPWGWTLLISVWVLAIAGVSLKILDRISHPIISTGIYVLMGWMVLVAANPLFERMPAAGLIWLVSGGMAYTIGVAFFATEHRLKYGHFIWHLFVLAGTVCHYFAVLWYSSG